MNKSWFTKDRLLMIVVIFGLIITILFLDKCRDIEYNNQKNTIDSLTLYNQALVKDKNKLNQTVYSQSVIISTNQMDMKKLLEENFKLKKIDNNRIKQVKALINEKTITQVEDITEGYDEYYIPPIVLDTCPKNVLYTPKTITRDSTEDPFFQFKATVDSDSFRIKNISFPDSQKIVIVESKGGLFKRDINHKLRLYIKPSVEIKVIHTNPYIKTIGLNSIVYQPKQKVRWLERTAIFLAGMFIGNRLTIH